MHHATAIAAPRDLFTGAGPMILDREDADFIGAVLGELGSSSGRAQLAATQAQARTPQQVLKLFQPIQRRFHVALIEAWCETPGTPRLDPAQVDKAGFVLRRLRRRSGQTSYEGWMKAGGKLRGWLPVDRLGDAAADPDPAVRLAKKDTGVAPIDRALRALGSTQDAALLAEDVTPMFVAPPEVCRQAGRSLYYGVVPTASSEQAPTEADTETETLFEGFGPSTTAFNRHLVQPLRGEAWDFPAPPNADSRHFDADWLDALLQAIPGTAEHRFVSLLRQVATEFDAFGEGASRQRLRTELAAISLRYALGEDETEPRTISAGDFLEDAIRVLLEGEGGSVELPQSWPELDSAAKQRLKQAMSGAMLDRFREINGHPGRFDEPDAQYVLRAFVRLKPDGGCPAKTVWSAYSEPFVIAPWYESASPPVQIRLPNLKDKGLLKSLKPNVSFVLPKELQNLLAGSPKDLMEGKGGGGGFEVGWICSFSIPVITFCAFIVLNIFLSLFDLIFRWMLFIKICIPYPKAK